MEGGRACRPVITRARTLTAFPPFPPSPPLSPLFLQLPFRQRSDRLLAWLRSHPSFLLGDVDIVDDLPASQGQRGIRARSAFSFGQDIMRIPLAANLSTETAMESAELGPLVENGVFADLSSMPTLLLGVHTLIEHAKCLLAAPTPDDLAVPVPCTELGGRTEAQIKADRAKAFQARKASAGGKVPAEMMGTKLSLAHPWGSRWRAFLSLLPRSTDEIGNCMAWKAADFKALAGTRAGHVGARLLRDVAKSYCSMYTSFVEVGVIDGLQSGA
jgi:hypothetical protein